MSKTRAQLWEQQAPILQAQLHRFQKKGLRNSLQNTTICNAQEQKQILKISYLEITAVYPPNKSIEKFVEANEFDAVGRIAEVVRKVFGGFQLFLCILAINSGQNAF